MERRDRSLELLSELTYLDSLENSEKAFLLEKWTVKFSDDIASNQFDLELNDLVKLSELLYKNIYFLKQYKNKIKQELENYDNIKKFLTI